MNVIIFNIPSSTHRVKYLLVVKTYCCCVNKEKLSYINRTEALYMIE